MLRKQIALNVMVKLSHAQNAVGFKIRDIKVISE